MSDQLQELARQNNDSIHHASTHQESPVVVWSDVVVNGWTLHITARTGATEADILSTSRELLKALMKIQGSAPTPPPLPSTNGNGNAHVEDPAFCDVHQCTMARREKDGQVWYSHKAGDAWCRG